MSIIISNLTETDGRNPIVLFDNLLVGSTPTVSPSSDVSDALTNSTYDAWEFGTSTTVTFDLGAAKEYSSLAIVGHNLFTKGVSVQLSSSSNGSTFTDINPSPIAIGDNTTKLILFNTREARYFRIVFSTSTAQTEVFIRSLILGKPLELPCGVGYGYTPIWMAQEYELILSKTLNGQFVGNRVISKGAKTDIPLLAVERGFVEEDLQPFMNHYNGGLPFIWAAGPTVFDKDVAYTWRQDGQEMKPTFDQSGNWMSLTMSIEGYVQ